MITVHIPFRTPTDNHLYYHKGNFRIIKKEARELRDKITSITSTIKHNLKDKELRVHVWVHEQWYCKNGNMAKKDIANKEKFLMDSVCRGLGLEDKWIVSHSMYKVDSSEEYSIITIEEITPDKPPKPSPTPIPQAPLSEQLACSEDKQANGKLVNKACETV